MSVKGKIARFYNDKPRAINSLWIMAQIASLLFVLSSLIALFISPIGTAMGVVMKIYDVFVIALVLFMYIWKTKNSDNLKKNELHIGYYVGLCMMTCMNLVVIAVLYGSQSNLIEIINGKQAAKTFYRLVAAFAIFAIFFYILYVYFSIRYHSDILVANRNSLKSKSQEESNKPEASTEMVLVKPTLNPTPASTEVPPTKPTMLALPAPSATPEPSNALVLAKPQAKPENAMVVAKPTTPAKPANGMLAPPGMR